MSCTPNRPCPSPSQLVAQSRCRSPASRCRRVENVKRSFDRNQQYSITAITDGGGAVVERYAYTAYGTPTITDNSGTTRTTTAIGNRYTYTGREWDETLALYHYRARIYDSVAGRFMSRDPLGFGKCGTCAYQAVNSKPVTLADPSGMLDEIPHSGGIGGPLHGEGSDGPFDPNDPFGLFPPFPPYGGNLSSPPPPYVPEIQWYPKIEFPKIDKPRVERERKFPKIEIPQRGWFPRCRPWNFEFDLKKDWFIERIGIETEWRF